MNGLLHEDEVDIHHMSRELGSKKDSEAQGLDYDIRCWIYLLNAISWLDVDTIAEALSQLFVANSVVANIHRAKAFGKTCERCSRHSSDILSIVIDVLNNEEACEALHTTMKGAGKG